ncbi:uncharacterized protein RSE6_02607 [Rhynchosporium secalis]|uniref:Letm1 RBD domain-containing protein n=1 Tax=Rhynchosporium secalis TaxID=38038 RepID=A0A1E1M0P8_RHYSE|nr:uncharacterized protein RSE6_02607 [Rhynchosporium secalis]
MSPSTLRGLRTAVQYQNAQRSISLCFISNSLHSISSPIKSKQKTHRPRYSSSSTSTSTSISTSKNKEASSKPKPKPQPIVNGPSSTLPTPIVIPVHEPGKSVFKHTLALGKSYITFYKAGIKNTYHNYRAAHALQRRLDKRKTPSFSSAIKARTITRSEFLLLSRNWYDIKRVPLFAAVLLVCGEFTPLVVLACTNIVPWTCRIPRQIDGDRKKLEKRRGISFRNLTAKVLKGKTKTEDLNRMQLLHISWSLGLCSSMWDYLGGQLPGLPTWLLRRRVANRVHMLEMDDTLIERAGGLKDMDIEELKLALVARGVDIMEKEEKDMKNDLNAWLKSREKVSVERLLLMRYA